jgi:hypothetical protein
LAKKKKGIVVETSYDQNLIVVTFLLIEVHMLSSRNKVFYNGILLIIYHVRFRLISCNQNHYHMINTGFNTTKRKRNAILQPSLDLARMHASSS